MTMDERFEGIVETVEALADEALAAEFAVAAEWRYREERVGCWQAE